MAAWSKGASGINVPMKCRRAWRGQWPWKEQFCFILVRDSNPGIPAHLLNPECRDWRCFNPGISGLWKMNKIPGFYMIFARKILFPRIFRGSSRLQTWEWAHSTPTPTASSWWTSFYWRMSFWLLLRCTWLHVLTFVCFVFCGVSSISQFRPFFRPFACPFCL